MLLNEYKLRMPKINMQDWEQAVKVASGLVAEVLKVQTRGVRLLRTVREPLASTERIGWLNMWSKVFAALEAVAAAITHNSKLVLLFTQRNTFELMLQMHTIVDPIRNLDKNMPHGSQAPHAQEYALRTSIDRLRAYTAWCLWHDKAYYKELLNPKSMRDIWSHDINDKIQPALENMPAYERFLEHMRTPPDEAAMREGSRNMRNLYTERIKQIDEWMADPQLRRWATVIDQAGKSNIVGIPFFILFDPSEVSIPKRLLKEGLRFSYSAYIQSSIASHGSSMEEFIDIRHDSLEPLFTGNKEQIEILAPEVIFRCQHIYTLLSVINDEMQKNPQIRS